MALTIGSRGSKLALWQANYIRERLEQLGYECRIRIIQTTGDRFQAGPLKEIGNKGLFTKEIEEALLDRSIDLAVHSLKDVPTFLPAGLRLTATPEREDPRDALVGSSIVALPHAARVGTGSLRRSAQLAHLRPDLRIEGIRGNVDTRLRKLDEGQFEAIVLAAAGLRRLGWGERITEYLGTDVMCPAVGQGCLALETRDDDREGTQASLRLDDQATHQAISAERTVLEVLGGGCQVPVGAYASVKDGRLSLQAVVIKPDGSCSIRQSRTGASVDAVQIGTAVGHDLLRAGAAEVLAAAHASS